MVPSIAVIWFLLIIVGALVGGVIGASPIGALIGALIAITAPFVVPTGLYGTGLLCNSIWNFFFKPKTDAGTSILAENKKQIAIDIDIAKEAYPRIQKMLPELPKQEHTDFDPGNTKDKKNSVQPTPTENQQQLEYFKTREFLRSIQPDINSIILSKEERYVLIRISREQITNGQALIDSFVEDAKNIRAVSKSGQMFMPEKNLPKSKHVVSCLPAIMDKLVEKGVIIEPQKKENTFIICV